MGPPSSYLPVNTHVRASALPTPDISLILVHWKENGFMIVGKKKNTQKNTPQVSKSCLLTFSAFLTSGCNMPGSRETRYKSHLSWGQPTEHYCEQSEAAERMKIFPMFSCQMTSAALFAVIFILLNWAQATCKCADRGTATCAHGLCVHTQVPHYLCLCFSICDAKADQLSPTWAQPHKPEHTSIYSDTLRIHSKAVVPRPVQRVPVHICAHKCLLVQLNTSG